ncbi:unnamed protein product [Porites evermanni]|uniref:Transposase n=1 Tax=Porites evermanni TaxID=104178 RepID=A0ABN8QMQ7_9CNID|nr:unnamed protein product [Porites evermanni]
MARRFFRHLEKDGHIPRRFSRTEWEDLAYWNARYNHDNWSRRIKTQFLSGTKLREIWQYVQRTWKCPDFRKKQKGGRRVLIKKFNHPLGEYSFFDREGKLQSISIYTLKVVYDRNWNGNVVYITAYPLF